MHRALARSQGRSLLGAGSGTVGHRGAVQEKGGMTHCSSRRPAAGLLSCPGVRAFVRASRVCAAQTVGRPRPPLLCACPVLLAASMGVWAVQRRVLRFVGRGVRAITTSQVCVGRWTPRMRRCAAAATIHRPASTREDDCAQRGRAEEATAAAAPTQSADCQWRAEARSRSAEGLLHERRRGQLPDAIRSERGGQRTGKLSDRKWSRDNLTIESHQDSRDRQQNSTRAMSLEPSSSLASASLLALHDIELQLLFHGLSLLERVWLARCCTRLLRLASAPLSWRHSVCAVSLPDSASPPPLSGVVRFAPLCVSLHSSGRRGLLDFAAQRWLEWLSAVATVTELDASAAPLSSVQLCRLVLSPALASVRALTLQPLDRPPTDDCSRHLMRDLPQLQSLQINPEWARRERSHHPLVPLANLMDQLPAFPRLTHLALSDAGCVAGATGSHLTYVARCAGLRSLTVRAPKLNGAAFLSFFSESAAMRRLECLSLDLFPADGDLRDVDAPSSADYALCFPMLTRLRSLRLAQCWKIDGIIAHVHLAPALTDLAMTSECAPFALEMGSAPSPAALVQLLRATYIGRAFAVSLTLRDLGSSTSRAYRTSALTLIERVETAFAEEPVLRSRLSITNEYEPKGRSSSQ